ncbi:uncharacterized protein [Triticum aestivum]|uniref:uncharacterized protein n=1 Tax=Triticum aestivum TaxID=4565 RepID=UPI001D00C62A|nr:uncharacterized protein LOC123044892 [Triticum aestivum]
MPLAFLLASASSGLEVDETLMQSVHAKLPQSSAPSQQEESNGNNTPSRSWCFSPWARLLTSAFAASTGRTEQPLCWSRLCDSTSLFVCKLSSLVDLERRNRVLNFYIYLHKICKNIMLCKNMAVQSPEVKKLRHLPLPPPLG